MLPLSQFQLRNVYACISWTKNSGKLPRLNQKKNHRPQYNHCDIDFFVFTATTNQFSHHFCCIFNRISAHWLWIQPFFFVVSIDVSFFYCFVFDSFHLKMIFGQRRILQTTNSNAQAHKLKKRLISWKIEESARSLHAIKLC